MLLEANAQQPVKGLDTKQDSYLVNGVVGAQGPNYILAKRLQVGSLFFHVLSLVMLN